MIYTSTEWDRLHNQRLLPETNVEVTCIAATDPSEVKNINDLASDTASAISDTNFIAMDAYSPYARQTLEHNLFVLDGSFRPTGQKCYANESVSGSGLELLLKKPTLTPIPGITIVWGKTETEGCASKFTVTAKNGETVLLTKTVSNNQKMVSVIDAVIDSYDCITIEILEWSLPNRRSRIYQVKLGQDLVFDKSKILSYEHEQSGHPNSGELTRNTITFSFDNHDGVWDPMNPNGFYRFLTERLRVDVRYGLLMNGVTEWIKVGSFFLSDWSVPSNGLEASFVAKDAFELLQMQANNLQGDTLYDLADRAFTVAANDGIVVFHSIAELANYPVGELDREQTKELSCAVVLQLCANAASCLIRHSRSRPGAIYINKEVGQALSYKIPLSLSYSYPEISFSKPLKAVSVSNGSGLTSVLTVSAVGETQTVENIMVSTEEQALEIAAWVKNALEPRITVKGSFRANPILDVFDVVTVESKYGNIYPVMLTYIKYIYSGSFRANYEGRVITMAEEA